MRRNHGGTVTIEANKLKYTPAANFVGEETFSYTIRNNAGDELTANITVQVAGVNDVPTANPDTVTVAEDAQLTTINVLQNDSFAPDLGETLTIKSAQTTGSKGGTIEVLSNSVIRYKPAGNATGTETFTYVVQDGNGGEATGTVTVTITAANDLPRAVDDTLSIPQNSSPNDRSAHQRYRSRW